MPRRAKGPRLYLKQRAGREAVWIIRDGPVERGTGCGEDRRGEAEVALATYIADKWAADDGIAERDPHDPRQVSVAEVLARYATRRAPLLATDGKTTAGFITHLLAFWGEMMLNEVGEENCEAYVAHRSAQPVSAYKDTATARRVSPQTAARELDTLSAAIGAWNKQWALTFRPTVAKPLKPESPRDALTRGQAARLLMAARGYRLEPEGALHPSGRPKWVRLANRSGPANRAHMKRILLIGFYTGSREKVMRSVLWQESARNAWADLEKAIIYRRGRGERETAKRRPVVKISPRLLAHMRRWKRMDEALAARIAAKDPAFKRRLAKAPTMHVVHHGGHPLAGRQRTGFEGCVRDAGLPPEVTPHWMRHTAATWLMESDCDMWKAAGYLGMTLQTLEKHYGHHRPDYQAGAARAIGGKR